MHPFNEISIVLVALLIVAGICLGLLVALVIFILGKQRNLLPATNAKRPAINQRRRSLYSSGASIAVGVGFAALVFASRLIPIKEDPNTAWVLIISGIIIVAIGLFCFSKI
ncbi:MAG: hypothetical protein WCA51_08445 [Dehalococcoidia bacterium]